MDRIHEHILLKLKRFYVDSVGQFHLEQMDGKSYVIYHPKPQKQIPTSSVEATSHDRPHHFSYVLLYVRKETCV